MHHTHSCDPRDVCTQGALAKTLTGDDAPEAAHTHSKLQHLSDTLQPRSAWHLLQNTFYLIISYGSYDLPLLPPVAPPHLMTSLGATWQVRPEHLRAGAPHQAEVPLHEQHRAREGRPARR